MFKKILASTLFMLAVTCGCGESNQGDISLATFPPCSSIKIENDCWGSQQLGGPTCAWAKYYNVCGDQWTGDN